MVFPSISRVSPQALTGQHEAAPTPATGQGGGAPQATARPAISGPLSGLSPAAANPRAPGAGPRPLGMPAQRLKIKGLPSPRAGDASAHAAAPSSACASEGATHAAGNPDATHTPGKPAPEHWTDVGSAVLASQHAALETMLMQNAMSQIQNQTALNQAQTSLREEAGKSMKALSQ